ncbi:thiamine-binding protein [Piscibacillus halophilus]|uniref:thiamine-binding protein n=1 Tax=Piscibacillus halophilus TaxID=571933 RepID=UPI00240A4506|nr:thiamine-binding protein [Piscibacillus halophilus]
MANTLVSIQIIPKTKNGEDVIPYVDEAIQVIEESGVNYQVNALETTLEGDLSHLLSVVEKMNKKMIKVGSPSVISQVKIAYHPEGITMDQLTEKYR